MAKSWLLTQAGTWRTAGAFPDGFKITYGGAEANPRVRILSGVVIQCLTDGSDTTNCNYNGDTTLAVGATTLNGSNFTVTVIGNGSVKTNTLTITGDVAVPCFVNDGASGVPATTDTLDTNGYALTCATTEACLAIGGTGSFEVTGEGQVTLDSGGFVSCPFTGVQNGKVLTSIEADQAIGAATQLSTDQAEVLAAAAYIDDTQTILGQAGTLDMDLYTLTSGIVWPDEANVSTIETAWGPTGDEYAGELDMSLYALISGVAAAGDVRSGVPRYTGGPNGTLDITADNYTNRRKN